MKYTAIIEIPKDCDRRIHKGNQPENLGKFVDFGPLKEVIPINDGKMPVAYGFIVGTVGTDGEGDEVDVMVFSNKDFKTEDSVEIQVFGMLRRADGDFKVLAHDDTMPINDFSELSEETQKAVLDFNGFKTPITGIENKSITISYLEKTMVN